MKSDEPIQLAGGTGSPYTQKMVAHEVSPRTVAWVDLMRDQSGLEPTEEDWVALADQPESLRNLLNEIGRVYVPAQLANAQAVQAGEQSWEAEIDGVPWSQQTFPYQSKCLGWTNERYRQLRETDQAIVDQVIEGTGVERLLVKS